MLVVVIVVLAAFSPNFLYPLAHPAVNNILGVCCHPEDASSVAIPIRKGEQALKEAVDTAIQELKDDGTLQDLSEKFFGEDIIS